MVNTLKGNGRFQGHLDFKVTKIVVEIIQDVNLENMCMQYESNQHSARS